MKKIIAALIFLFILSGCQLSPEKKETLSTTNASAEKSTLQTSKMTSTEETNVKNEKTYASGSLIQAVIDNNKEETAAILKTAAYPIDETNEKSETPLMIAVHNNQVEIAKQLIDAGADINKQDSIQDSPYLYAGAEGRTEILSYMLAHSEPDQSIRNRFGGNALIPAAEKGHLENVRLLLKDGRANIDHQNDYGYTALIEAVALRNGSQVYQDIVAELMNSGANPDIVDNYGKTAADYAKELGYQNILYLLQAA